MDFNIDAASANAFLGGEKASNAIGVPPKAGLKMPASYNAAQVQPPGPSIEQLYNQAFPPAPAPAPIQGPVVLTNGKQLYAGGQLVDMGNLSAIDNALKSGVAIHQGGEIPQGFEAVPAGMMQGYIDWAGQQRGAGSAVSEMGRMGIAGVRSLGGQGLRTLAVPFEAGGAPNKWLNEAAATVEGDQVPDVYGRNPVSSGLIHAAHVAGMVAPIAAVDVAAAAVPALAPVVAPTNMLMIGAMGGSTYETRFQEGKARGMSDSDARTYAGIHAGINTAGMAAAGHAIRGVLGKTGGAVTSKELGEVGGGGALGQATSGKWLGQAGENIAKNAAVDAGIFGGLGVAATAVDNAYEVSDANPLTEGLTGAATGALMAPFMAPFAMAKANIAARQRTAIADRFNNPSDPVDLLTAASKLHDAVRPTVGQPADAWMREQSQRVHDQLKPEPRKAGKDVGYDDLVGPSQPNAGPTIDMFGGKGTVAPHYYTDGTDRPAPPPGGVPPINQEHANDLRRQLRQIQMMVQTHQLTPEQAIAAARAGNEIQEQLRQMSEGRPINPPATAMYDSEGNLVRSPQMAFDFGKSDFRMPTEGSAEYLSRVNADAKGNAFAPHERFPALPNIAHPPIIAHPDGTLVHSTDNSPATVVQEVKTLAPGTKDMFSGERALQQEAPLRGVVRDFDAALSTGQYDLAMQIGRSAAAHANLLGPFQTLMHAYQLSPTPEKILPSIRSIVAKGELAMGSKEAAKELSPPPKLTEAKRKKQITKASGGAETQSRLQELIETGKQVWADAKEAIAKLRAKHKSTASVRDDAELKLRLLKDEFDKAAKNRNMGKLLQLQEQMEMFAHRDIGEPPLGKHALLAMEVHDLWRQGRLSDDSAESILNAIRNQKGEKHIMALRDKYVVPAIEGKLKAVGDFEKRAKTHDENAVEDANTSVGADKDTVLEIAKYIQLLGGNDLTRHIELAKLINIARRGYTQRDKLIEEDIANRLIDDRDTAELANAAIEEFLTSNKDRNKRAREVNDADLAFAEARSRRMDEGAGQDVGGLTKESRRQVDSLRARINKSNDDGTAGNPWRILNKYASAHYEPITRDDVMPDGTVVRAVELSATDRLLRDIVSDLHAEPFKKLTDEGLTRIIDIMSKKYSPEVMEVVTRHMDLSPIVRVAQARFSRPDNHLNRENEYTNRRVVALINELGKDSNVPGVAERRKVLKDKLDEMYEWYRKGMGAGVMRPSFAQFIERLLGSEGLTKMYHGTKGPKGKIQVEMLKLRTDLRNVEADERLGKIGLSIQEAVKGKAEKKESTRKRAKEDQIGNEELEDAYPVSETAESVSDTPRDTKNPPIYSKVDNEPYRVSYELEKNPDGDTIVKSLSAVNELTGKHDDSIEAWKGKTAREVLRGLGQRLGISHEAFNEMKNAVDADTRAEIARKKVAEESAAAAAGERERERNRKEVEKFTSDNAVVMKQVSKLEKAGFTVSMGKDKLGRMIITGEKEGTEPGKFVRRVITLPKDGKKPTSDIVSSVEGKMAHKQEFVPPAHEGVVKGGLNGLTPDVKAELEKSKARVEIPDVPEAPEAEQGKPKKTPRKATTPTVDERIEKIRDFLADVKAGKVRATMPKLLELARSIEMETKARTGADGAVEVPSPTIPNLSARLGAAVENSDRITGRVVPLKTRAQAITEEKMKKSVSEKITDPSDERSVRAALEELAGYGGPGEAVPNKSRIQIYGDVKDVPEASRHLFADGEAGIAWEGERAIIVANRVQRGNEKGILLHEVGTHVGLEKLIGADNVRAVSDRIHDFGKNGTAIEREAVAAAQKRIPKDTPPEDVHKELIGYTAEELVKRGITPKGVGKAAQLLRDVRKWVVKALNGTGLFHITEGKLDGQDLVNLLQGSLARTMWSPEPAPTKPTGGRVMRSVAEAKDPRKTIWTKAEMMRAVSKMPESQQAVAIKAVEAMKNVSDKWLGMAFLGDLADYMKPYLPAVADLYDIQHSRSAKALELTTKVDRHGQDFMELKRAERNAVDAAIKEMDAEKVWGFDPKAFGSKRGYDVTVAKGSKAESMFNALSPEAKKIVAAHFELGHEMIGALKVALRERAEDAYKEMLKDGESEERAAALRDKTLAQIKMDFPEKAGPYSPLVRTGEWMAVGKSKEFAELQELTSDGTVGTKEEIKRYKELEQDPAHKQVLKGERGQMEIERRRMEKEGMTANKFPEEVFSRQSEAPYQMIEKLKAMLTNHANDLGIDGKVLSAAKRSLGEMYLSSMADTSAKHSSQHRRNIAGAREDRVIASLEHYKSMAHLTALLTHSGDLHKAIENIRNQAHKGYTLDETGERVPLKGTMEQRKIYAREVLLRNALNHVHLEDPFNQTRLLQFTAGMRIVTSPAFYLQQLTEPFMVMLPLLAARHKDYPGALAAMWASRSDAYKAVGGITNKRTFDPSLLGTNAKEKEMIEYMMNRGRIDMGHFTDLGGVGDGPLSEAYAKSVGRVMRVATNLEAVNRVMSSLTAYRLEMKKNGGDHEQAMKETDRLVRITHGEFDAFSTPRYMMQQQWPGVPVRLITQFKKFQVMQVSLMARMVHDAFADAPPEEKKIARAMLGYAFGQFALVTGAMGLPGYGLAATLIDWLLKDGKEPLNPDAHLNDFLSGHMGQTMADLITKGIPGAMGVPLTSRIGAGGMLSFAPIEHIDVSDRSQFAETALSFMGPFVGLVSNDMIGAYGKMRQGDYYKATELMMPTLLRSNMRAFRFATEGVTNSKNDILLSPEDLTMLEKSMAAVGFNSTRLELRAMAESYKYQVEHFYKVKYQRLATEYAKTRREGGDTSELRDTWMEYQEAERKLGLLPTPIGGMYRAEGAQLKREAKTVEGSQWNKHNRGFVLDHAEQRQ